MKEIILGQSGQTTIRLRELTCKDVEVVSTTRKQDSSRFDANSRKYVISVGGDDDLILATIPKNKRAEIAQFLVQ